MISFYTTNEDFILRTAHYGEDKDLCLFKDFPFENLVFISIEFTLIDEMNSFSCIFLWLAKHFRLYADMQKQKGNYYFLDLLEKTFNNSNFEACEFEKRMHLCNKNEFRLAQSNSTFTTIDFMILSEFLLILFSPFACILGIISNLVVIVVLKKDNKKP